MGAHVARGAFGLVALLVVVGLAGGCAGYKIQENGTGCGYDVYAPEPYLQATPKVVKDSTGADVWVYDFSLIWLPNYSKRYRVYSWAGLGKAEFEFKFEHGWQLTSISDKSSNTNIMEALTGLAKQLLPTDPWKVDKEQGAKGPSYQPAILYRIDFDKDGRPACLKRLAIDETSCTGTGAFPLHPGPCR